MLMVDRVGLLSSEVGCYRYCVRRTRVSHLGNKFREEQWLIQKPGFGKLWSNSNDVVPYTTTTWEFDSIDGTVNYISALVLRFF